MKYLDANDQPGHVVLLREQPTDKPVKLGLLPPLYPEVRVSQTGDVGILSFNLFLSEGVLPKVSERARRLPRPRGQGGDPRPARQPRAARARWPSRSPPGWSTSR